MSDERREAQQAGGRHTAHQLLSPTEVLKRRESWKYLKLEAALQGRQFEFEYELGGYVFDLALLDTRVLIEFDGPYHLSGAQQADDAKKDAVAHAHGYNVVRRSVVANTAFTPDMIAGL